MGIEFRNVTKTFGGACVVDDLSLEVSDGEFIVLLGPACIQMMRVLFPTLKGQ